MVSFVYGLNDVTDEANLVAVLDVFGPNLSTVCPFVPCINDTGLINTSRSKVKIGNGTGKLLALRSANRI